MGLWAEMKPGPVSSVGRLSGLKNEQAAVDQATGKKMILLTLRQISDLWCVIERNGGSIAWVWILRGSQHGLRIQAAEDQVNNIGSTGDLAALTTACNAWLGVWRDGIEAWKRTARSKKEA